MSRTWRTEKVSKSKGIYWVLKTGRNEERVTLGLGYVSGAEAATALTRIQREEDQGTIHSLLLTHKENSAEAVEYLIGDAGADELLAATPPKPNYSKMKLRQYVDDVFASVRERTNPKSWRTEAGNWKRIKEGLGALRLDEVDARAFVRWARDLQVVPRNVPGAEPRPASGQYKAHMRMTLQACLSHAYIEGHVQAHVRLGEVRLKGSTERVVQKADPLTLDEVASIMKVARPKHRAMWATAAGQGLRPSELCRLRWEDVRWETQTLMVRGDEDGKGKTELSVDEIPLTPLARKELRDWWMRQGQPKSGIIFAARGGKAYESTYRRALDNDARKAGIARHVNPYLLRDSFATICWSLDIPKDTARRVLRHTDEAMLDRIYCRPRPADLVARVAAFDLASR